MLSINNPFIAIEKQQAMPDQGVSSTAKTMKNYGILVGIAHSLYEMGDLCTSYAMIPPVTWKNYYKKNYYRITEKKDACKLASELSGKSFILPKCRTPHDGLAEAYLIAEYSRRMNK
jgi:hypothetical protein